MWKLLGIGHRKAGSESDEAMLTAAIVLRVELLYAAVIYGTWSVLVAGGRDIEEWQGWVAWVRNLFTTIAASDESLPDHDLPPEWLREVIQALDHTEELAHDAVDDRAFRRWARDEFERLAELARPIEQGGAEPLGELHGDSSGAGLMLLGVVQDSLTLICAADEMTRDKRAGAAEIIECLRAARNEGVWSGLSDEQP